MKRKNQTKRDRREYVIMDVSREHAYLCLFEETGPLFLGAPTTFTKQEADNLLAKAQKDGWLVGDLEIIRF